MKKSEAMILVFIFTLPYCVFAQGNVGIDSSAPVSLFTINGFRSDLKMDLSSKSFLEIRKAAL